MAKKSKASKKKAPGATAAKGEETKAPTAEPEASKAAEPAKKKAPVKKASKKAAKKDDGRPAGAPPADHCDAEWETKTHHIYKLKFKHVGPGGQRKILIVK